MEEILPIVSGFLVGALAHRLRPSLRLIATVPIGIAFGVLATVLSGEFQVSWSFLAIDIPLVALGAAVGWRVGAVAPASAPGGREGPA